MGKRLLCIIIFLSSLLIYFNCNGDLLDEGPGAITSVTMSNIQSLSTINSAMITWTTDAKCTHLIEYGTASGTYTSSTVQSTSETTSHSIEITGLSVGTTYYFRIRCFTSPYGYSISTEQNFTTQSDTTPTLAQKRRGVWIIGGSTTTAGTAVYSQLDLYDPVNNTWYPDVASGASGSYIPTTFPAVASVDDKIFIIGGANAGLGVVNSVYEYDIANNSWSTKTTMPVPLMASSAYVNDDKIFIIGGTTTTLITGAALTHHYYYNVEINTWSALGDLVQYGTTPRSGLAVVNFNGMVSYAGGRINTGTGAGSQLNDIYIIASNTLSGATETALATARGGMAYAGYAGINGANLFLIGGASAFTTNSYYNTIPTYVPQAQCFQAYPPPYSTANYYAYGTNHPAFSAPDTTKGLIFASAVVSLYNGSTNEDPTLYVFGGLKDQSTLTDEVYSITANGITVMGTGTTGTYANGISWSPKAAMSRARYGHAAVTINQ